MRAADPATSDAIVSNATRLDDRDRERFTEAVESSYAVVTRQQFFVWTQSALQALLPHEVLICGIEDGSRLGMSMHRFSASRYFRQEHFDALADPLTGIAPLVVAAMGRQRGPVVLSPSETDADGGDGLAALIDANELKSIAAYPVIGASGRLDALYVFGRISAPLDKRLAYAVDLTGPHLHVAFLRVLATEKEAAGPNRQRAGRLVTRRQEEILQLIKHGKTNAEIADVLECSPWTVKNHIQAILRKLDTNTRSHAIAKAMSLGILKPD